MSANSNKVVVTSMTSSARQEQQLRAPLMTPTSHGAMNPYNNGAIRHRANLQAESLEHAQEPGLADTGLQNVDDSAYAEIVRKADNRRLMSAFYGGTGEFLSTMILIYVVCCVCMSGVVSGYSAGEQHLANALVVTFVVSALLYAFIDVCGAHLNPAVTIALFLSGMTSPRRLVLYILSQFTGAFAALFLVYLTFNCNENNINPKTNESVNLWYQLDVIPQAPAGWLSVFVTKFIGTFILIFIMLKGLVERMQQPETSPPRTVGALIIGCTVGMLTLLSQSSSGGVFNPARILPPAVFTGRFDYVYVYVVAQICGAVTAVAVNKSFNFIRKEFDPENNGFNHHHKQKYVEKQQQQQVQQQYQSSGNMNIRSTLPSMSSSDNHNAMQIPQHRLVHIQGEDHHVVA